MVGGVAAAAAVRTFPFRVFSFPKEISTKVFFEEFLTPPAMFGGAKGSGKLISLAGLPYRVDPYLPRNEVWLVREAKVSTLHIHEGPKAGQNLSHIIKPGYILRVIDLRSSQESAIGNFHNLERFPYPGKLYTPFAPRSSD